MLPATIEGQYHQRLCERALLNEGFAVDATTQRDLVTAMAQVALDAGKYDARRRTQAALTLAKFQTMRVSELEKREEFRLREEALKKTDSPDVVVNNTIGIATAIEAVQSDPQYLEFLRCKALEEHGIGGRETEPASRLFMAPDFVE